MEDTLLIGDRVFVDKRAYGLRIPFTTIEITAGEPVRRGDIAIFDSPADGKRLIKRIVAVGGDDVVIADGRLSINDRWLQSGADAAIEVFGDKHALLNLRDGRRSRLARVNSGLGTYSPLAIIAAIVPMAAYLAWWLQMKSTAKLSRFTTAAVLALAGSRCRSNSLIGHFRRSHRYGCGAPLRSR